MNLIWRPFTKTVHFLVLRDLRHRHVPRIAIRLYANTRPRPLQYRLQAPVEPRIARPVIRVANRPQVVVRHPNGVQIVARELTQHLAVRHPDDLEVARAVERELHGTFLGGAEDGGPVWLCELRR